MSEVTTTAPRKRGRPRKDAAPATVIADPVDRKLDHFSTTTDARQLDWWEADQSLSPLHVPKEITDKYPDRRFHWSSENKWKRNGKNYHGWQTFTNAEYPDGLKRGNESFLTWMPEERAARYNKYVARESGNRVRGQQDNQTEKVGRSTEEMKIEGGLTIGARPMTGMLVNGKFIPSGARGHRGYSPDQIKEAVAKAQESRAKNRKYYT